VPGFGEILVDLPLRRRVRVVGISPEAAPLDAAPAHERLKRSRDQDVVEAVPEGAALEGPRAVAGLELGKGVDVDERPVGGKERLAVGRVLRAPFSADELEDAVRTRRRRRFGRRPPERS
jgi:hypothetical protein